MEHESRGAVLDTTVVRFPLVGPVGVAECTRLWMVLAAAEYAG